MKDGATPEARARARASWPIRRLSLEQDEGTEDLARVTSVEQRLAMMWELAVRSWALAGRALPDWISTKKGPSGYRELIVGDAAGRLDLAGAVSPLPDAWFNASEIVQCAEDAGTIDRSEKFFVRLAHWYAVDRSTTEEGTVTIHWDLEECTTSGCPPASCTFLGSPTAFTADFAAGSYLPINRDWTEADRFDASRGILVTAPSTSGVSRWLFLVLQVTVDDSSAPVMATSYGCAKYTTN